MQDYEDQDLNELPSTSPNFRTDLAKKLEKLVPEAIADGKVDVVKLKELLAEDAGEPNERFGLFWPGKKQALRAAQDPTTATLKPAKDESKDWDTTNNIFIEGDNLEVLKVLQKQYHNSIKMIYIDPPYNTGKDFVYPDNFKEGLQNYLEFSQQVDEGNKKISTNTETAGRYHSNWLNMMYPRLKLARNLLTDDGVIFVSIDNYEVDNLRKILDEIFGEDNFQCIFVWLRKTSPKGVPPVNMVVNSQEYILCYSRSSKFKFIGEPRSKEGFSNPDNDPRGIWRNTNIKSTVKDKSTAFSITDPLSGNKYTDTWAFSPRQLDKMIAEGQVIFPKNPLGQVRAKEYFNEFKNSNIPIITFLGKFDGQSASELLTKLMNGKFFQTLKIHLYCSKLYLILSIETLSFSTSSPAQPPPLMLSCSSTPKMAVIASTLWCSCLSRLTKRARRLRPATKRLAILPVSGSIGRVKRLRLTLLTSWLSVRRRWMLDIALTNWLIPISPSGKARRQAI